MSKATEQAERDFSAYEDALKARAQRIKSVRNDIFNLNKPLIAVNVILGGGAAAGLIGSVAASGTVKTVMTVVGVALAIIFVVYSFALRTVMPMSLLQFSYVEGDRRYTFQVITKTRSAFSDEKNFVEAERGNATRRSELCCSQYRFDFFADMKITGRETDGMKETFIGIYEHKSKKYKCKITFDGETPLYGTIGGGRIKYFDINSPKYKFVVPTELRRAVKSFDIPFPKINGLLVRDDKHNR